MTEQHEAENKQQDNKKIVYMVMRAYGGVIIFVALIYAYFIEFKNFEFLGNGMDIIFAGSLVFVGAVDFIVAEKFFKPGRNDR